MLRTTSEGLQFSGLRMPFYTPSCAAWHHWHPAIRISNGSAPPRRRQAQTREVLESRLTAAKLRRAKRKAREAVDAAGAGGGYHRGGGGGGGGGNSRASSATSVISSCHPSPAKQAVSGRCAGLWRVT